MSPPHDPNVTADRPVGPDGVSADTSRGGGPLSTVDHSADPASTGGSYPSAGAPAADLPTIPGYRVVREIARGGMGRVLAAVDLALDRDVAVKVLLPGADPARFVRESKVTARLPHPGVPPVYALGTLADGSPFLAMKLVAGQTLSAELKAADRPRLLPAFAQVCQAVGFAHSKGVIHRDLKPANVMVGAFGEVQVMDWGLAKLAAGPDTRGDPRPSGEPDTLPDVADADRTTDHPGSGESTDGQTRAGAVMGTPAYMAPEQARGEPADPRADVFALGGILCAILTGQPPFRGAAAAEVVRRAAAADLADAFARLAGCGADAELVALCNRCLSPAPEDRPADGRAVAEELTAYLTGVEERLRAAEVARGAEAARADEATRTAAQATERARAERRARRALVVGSTLVLLVLVAGIVGTGVGLVQARQAKLKAETAEGETKQRSQELQKVVGFQDKMLQLDPAEAGLQLVADLLARHAAALEKGKVAAAERAARTAAFERELRAVNATDAAVTLLDRTVLSPAARTVEAEFTNEPLVDASLRMTLAAVYSTLGRPEQALAYYQRAYETRAAALAEDHPDTLAARAGVGKTLGELQQLAEAEATVRGTLEVSERALGEDHPMTLDAKSLLAWQVYNRGRYEESEARGRDVLDRRRRVQGPDHADTLRAMRDLGQFLTVRGKYADAVAILREAAEKQRRAEDPHVATTLASLGAALVRQKEFTAAEPYLRESLDLRRRARGEDHPQTLAAAVTLGTLLMDLGKLPEAETLVKDALAKSRRLHGDEHVNTLMAINVMGQILFRQNKYVETEPLYREAVAAGRRVLGEDHPDTIVWIANLGFLMQRLGRMPEAEAYYREALEKNRGRLGDTHPYTITALRSLTDLLRQQNKLVEAEGHLRRALEQLRAKEGDDHPDTLSLVGLLGGVLRDQNKLSEAEPLFQQAVETNRRLYGDGHANTLTAVLRMATLRAAQGNHTEVLDLLVPVEDQVKKAFPGGLGILRHAALLGLVGKARAGLAKDAAEFARAETDLLEAHGVFAKTRGERDKETREWAQAVADLYAAWDKAEPGKGYAAKAAAWRAKLPKEALPRPREAK